MRVVSLAEGFVSLAEGYDVLYLRAIESSIAARVCFPWACKVFFEKADLLCASG